MTPIRSELTALIFNKSMRMKDTTSAGNFEPNNHREEKTESKEVDLEDDSISSNEDEIPLMNMQETQSDPPKRAEEPVRAVVNLLGVDVQRVSMFCGENALLLGSFLKLFLGFGFLVYLMVWRR